MIEDAISLAVRIHSLGLHRPGHITGKGRAAGSQRADTKISGRAGSLCRGCARWEENERFTCSSHEWVQDSKHKPLLGKSVSTVT